LDKPSGGSDITGVADSFSGRRHVWVCADDYGISTAVNVGIRDLVVRRRLNATSVMVVAPSFHRSEAHALDVLNTGMARVAILVRAFLHRLGHDALVGEIAAQLRMFVHTFGRAPDFIDGHQHVHLFPQIRDAVLDVAKANAPGAWLRQCGRAAPPRRLSLRDRKALLLDHLSHDFRQRAGERGMRTNPAFAGAYEFRDDADFAALFAGFLDQLPDGGLIMCHPGFVDAELQRLDPLTTLRQREHAFLAGESFPDMLASHGVALA
jgi:chitin disaccharide deacetylase